ncbi:hypothetical protein [Pseudoxanthomonas sp. UTMC 1351]|uniref:hypothetical protein n=1 Tax=Pseudoxanthomonas sp. UTMC 1351 TaxID=2695853 RepID=UPI0034CF16C7
MLPRKTDLARTALQSHAGPLSMRERRTLILCDGQRDLPSLVDLLGQDAPLLIRKLCGAGYLVDAASEISAVALPAPAIAPTQPTPRASGARRSMAAAKLYMLDMLALQRHDAAIRHKAELQACHEPEETFAQLLASLRCLQDTSAASLARRVRERLAEVLPEDCLAALESMDLPAATSATAQ